jgi:hypothetical protein
MTYQEYIRKHPDRKEELEERAAIIEYQGGRHKALAEKMAVRVLMDKYGG